MRSLLFLLPALTVHGLDLFSNRPETTISVFRLPSDVDIVTIEWSDANAITYAYTTACVTSYITPGTLTPTNTEDSSITNSPTATNTDDSRITNAPISIPPSSSSTQNQKRQLEPASGYVASCDIVTVTQGASTWKARWYITSNSASQTISHRVDGTCTFGSGGMTSGTATCSESTGGDATSRPASTIAPREYRQSIVGIGATIRLETPTTTALASFSRTQTSSSTSGIAGSVPLPTNMAIVFAGGAAGMLAAGLAAI